MRLEKFRVLLAGAFGGITSLRNILYDKNFFSVYQSCLPVISVGNVSVGGTGKTPLCLYIASLLKSHGKRPVILTRGYKGSLKGPHIVSDADSYEECGDEPILMHRSKIAPIVVARKRAAGAILIEKQKLGDVIILDDGLQHRQLERDVNIVNINISSQGAVDSFVHNKLLPHGVLREDRNQALSRADILILSNRKPAKLMSEPSQELMSSLPGSLPIFFSSYEADGVLAINNSAKLEPSEVFAFCAIANPESFVETLESLGFTVKERCFFSDHYNLTREDIELLKGKAGKMPLVCTEKDAVKISKAYLENIYFVRGSAKVVPDREFLQQILKKVLNKK